MSETRSDPDGTAEPLSEAAAEEAVALLRVIANPNRLRILRLLVKGERAVGEIERILGIRQPSLSQQLGELRDAGLVATRREHKVVFYDLTDTRTIALLAALDRIFGAAAPRLRRASSPRSDRRGDQAAIFAVVGGAP